MQPFVGQLNASIGLNARTKRLRKIFAVAALAMPPLLVGNGARAGDVSMLSPPPLFTWSGFYGGQAGAYTWTGNGAARPDGFWSTALDAAGSAFAAANSASQFHSSLGGGQLGFNYQIQSFVVGGEADLTYTGLDTTSAVVLGSGNLAFTPDVSSHWLATMRGRFGAAIDRLLVYGTGGLAVAQRNFTNGYMVLSPDGEDFSIGSASRTAAGLAIGGGLEYALTKNWTLKGEYLYANLGSGKAFSNDGASVPLNPSFHQGDLDEKVVRAAVNYKFDWFAQQGPAFDSK